MVWPGMNWVKVNSLEKHCPGSSGMNNPPPKSTLGSKVNGWPSTDTDKSTCSPVQATWLNGSIVHTGSLLT